MQTLLLTASLDGRYGQGKITSRIGLTSDAHMFDETTDMRDLIAQEHEASDAALHCVLVDEVLFLSEGQVWQLADVADDLNIPVMCYGLRTDFQGNLFLGRCAAAGHCR